MRTAILTTQVTALFLAVFMPVYASASSPLPAAAQNSAHPLSADNVSAAGTLSASSPRAAFVPQIARQGGEADPVLVAQTGHKTEQMDSAKNIDIIDTTSAYWGNILARYLKTDDDNLTRFDYAALKASPKDMAKLDAYIAYLANQKPSGFTRGEAMAYWANLYNALTVQIVAQNYPVTSIRKIKSGLLPGPWKRKLVSVEGRELSLDNIEHGIMRPTFQTPLVHYMVNCASIGCPNLKVTPWRAAGLADELDREARAYINSPRGAIVVNDRLQVSKIYKWFKKDFGGDTPGVLAHIRQYADADLLAALEGRQKIDKYVYDWDVNAPK